MKSISLLSPAKNLICALYAYHYGADSVYLGIGKYNARAEGENFSFEDLKKLLYYKESEQKKIYLTLNILFKNRELENAFEILDAVYNYPIDAIIVQDLGVARLIKEYFPKFELHASTQMAVTNLDGALFLEDFGFKQVVLARELSLKEIEKIKLKTNLKLEVFIHGAMCYSVSGMCLASSILGGESGNRGKCSQVCRMKFYYEGNKSFWGYPFNLKDLYTVNLLKDLIPLVDTLKIEGRMKDEYYVAVNTYIYRKVLDSLLKGEKIDKDKLEYFKQLSCCIFSREKWEGYYKNSSPQNNINPNYPGNIGLFIGNILFLNKERIKIKLKQNLKIPIYPFDTIQLFQKDFKDKNILIQIESVKTKGNILLAKIRKISNSNFNINNLNKKVYLISSNYVKNKFKVNLPNLKKYKSKYPVKIFLDFDKKEISLIYKNKTFIEKIDILVPKKIKTTKNDIKKILERSSKDFVFLVEDIFYNENYFIPSSEISKVKKIFYEKFEKFLKEEQKNLKEKFKNSLKKSFINFKQKYKILIVFDTINFETFLKLIDEGYFNENILLFYKITDLSRLYLVKEHLKILKKKNINLAFKFPLGIFEDNRIILEDFIKENKNLFPSTFLINHFWELKFLEKHFNNFNFYLDSFFYVLNIYTIKFIYEKYKNNFLGFAYSYEDELENIKNLPEGYLTFYSDIPLFISRTCIKKVFEKCSKFCKDIFLKKKHLKKNIYEVFTGRLFDCKFFLFWKLPLNLNSKKDFFSYFKLKKYEFCYFRFEKDKIIDILEGRNNIGHLANLLRNLK